MKKRFGCIQIGTITIQGHISATYPDPDGEYGSILSQGRVRIGKLIPSYRAEAKKARYGDEELSEIKQWLAGQ